MTEAGAWETTKNSTRMGRALLVCAVTPEDAIKASWKMITSAFGCEVWAVNYLG